MKRLALALVLALASPAMAQPALKSCGVQIHPEWNDGLDGIAAFGVTVTSNGLWQGGCINAYEQAAENPEGGTLRVAGVTTNRLRGTEADFYCRALFDIDDEPQLTVAASEVVSQADGEVPAVVTAESLECFPVAEHDSNRNGRHDVGDPLCSILVLVGLPCG